jgi:CRP-like cAMP-binding protein
MDLLVGLLPSLGGLSRAEREALMTQGRILDVAPGTRLTQAGDRSDSAYFVLAGKAVAGISEGQGNYHSLSGMTAGDFFGEIAALTGAARTADVVAEEPTQLLQVPASVLRVIMAQPAFSQVVLKRMSERLARTSIHDLPRFAGLDEQSARELRAEPAAAQGGETLEA